MMDELFMNIVSEHESGFSVRKTEGPCDDTFWLHSVSFSARAVIDYYTFISDKIPTMKNIKDFVQVKYCIRKRIEFTQRELLFAAEKIFELRQKYRRIILSTNQDEVEPNWTFPDNKIK
jgi:hypothetical protein